MAGGSCRSTQSRSVFTSVVTFAKGTPMSRRFWSPASDGPKPMSIPALESTSPSMRAGFGSSVSSDGMDGKVSTRERPPTGNCWMLTVPLPEDSTVPVR